MALDGNIKVWDGNQWIQTGGGGNGSSYSVVIPSSSYTASDEEMVISDGYDVTLPSPSQNAIVGISALSNISVTAQSGSVETDTSVTLSSSETAQFASDGSNWYLITHRDAISTIPDSVVSRPQDDSSTSVSSKVGLAITTTVEWPDIGATISSNTVGLSTAYCYRVSDGSLLGSTDISSLSAGDSFVLEDVNLQPDDGTDATTYNIMADNDGSSYTSGFVSAVSVPITSSDGQLTIEQLATGPSSVYDQSNPDLNNIVSIGNVGF